MSTRPTRCVAFSLDRIPPELELVILTPSTATATIAQLKAAGPSRILQLETRDEESIARLAKSLEGVAIDLLINNAGVLEEGTFETTTKESLMRQFEINSVAPFLVTRALVGSLRLAAQTRGEAVVASLSTMLGSITINSGGQYHNMKMVYGGRYGYRSSKTALNMINSCLAVDLKADKIVAVVLQPGYVNTDLTYGRGLLQPEDSVAGMTTVIAGLTQDDNGKFFDFTGPELPW
jgi:NAD(P)-dependent dehydrogenase (short-subunit alcohol dehydrogenase family)